MRLIDANGFRRFAHEQLDEYNVYSVDEILEMIDEQPTVEAKPVVHGEWIRKNVQKSFGKSIDWICSICGKKSWLGYDFCPNCGADMRGGKHD